LGLKRSTPGGPSTFRHHLANKTKQNKNGVLSDRESNPGRPRDRRKY
jgi:hypothetical protein